VAEAPARDFRTDSHGFAKKALHCRGILTATRMIAPFSRVTIDEWES
jgi:hypothetical protein